jgi:hypothetical protein
MDAMKVLLIVIGTLGGLFALSGIFGVYQAASGSPATLYGTANVASSVVLVVLGLIVFLFCFQRAFRKPER